MFNSKYLYINVLTYYQIMCQLEIHCINVQLRLIFYKIKYY